MPFDAYDDLIDSVLPKRRNTHDEIINRHSKRTKLDPEFVRRVIVQESGGNSRAKSWAGAQGLGQLMPGTAKRYGVKNPNDPNENVRGATDYLRDLTNEFKEPEKVLAAYNAGEGRVRKLGYERTRKLSNLPKGDPRRGSYQGSTGQYVDKILKGYQKPTPQRDAYDDLLDEVIPQKADEYDSLIDSVVAEAPTQQPQPTRAQVAKSYAAKDPFAGVKGRVRGRVNRNTAPTDPFAGVTGAASGAIRGIGAGELRQLDQPETERIIRAQQQVANEPSRRANARLLEGSLPDAEEAARRASEEKQHDVGIQEAEAERARLIKSFTPEEIEQTKKIADQLRRHGPGVRRGVDKAVQRAASGLMYKLAGVTDLLGPSKVLGGRPEDNPLGETLRRKALAGELSIEELQNLPQPQREKVAEFLTGLTVGLVEITATPGGPISKFAGLAGTEAVGRNASRAEIAKETAKGAGVGAVFKYAGRANRPAETLGGRAANLAKEGGVIGAGTYGVEKAFGTPDEDALLSAATNVALHGTLGARRLRGRKPEDATTNIQGRGAIVSPNAKGVPEPTANGEPRDISSDVRKPLGENLRAATDQEVSLRGDVERLPTEQPQRFQHLQFGEIEVAPEQSGARKGKVKVFEVANPDRQHFVSKADMQGRGNARMIPLRSAEQPAPAEIITPQETANKPLESSAEAVREVQPSLPKVTASTPSVTPEVSPKQSQVDEAKPSQLSASESERQSVESALPQELSALAKDVKGKGYEAAKRAIVSKVGSVGRGEKFDDDVADAVFQRLQRNVQVGAISSEADLPQGRDAQRMEGSEPITVYRATEGATIRPGDYVANSEHEAGFYMHGKNRVRKLTVPQSDLISVRGAVGGGKEYIYLPKGYEAPTPKEHYKTFREFYDAVHRKVEQPSTSDVLTIPERGIRARPETKSESTSVERAANAAKEPWETTKAEWDASVTVGATETLQPMVRSHKQQVKDAIADGKPVPAEVLADYPELAAKAAQTTESGEATGNAAPRSSETPPFDADRYAEFFFDKNPVSLTELDYYAGRTGKDPHGIPDEVWQRAFNKKKDAITIYKGATKDIKEEYLGRLVDNPEIAAKFAAPKSSVKGETNEPQVSLRTEVKEPKLSVESKQTGSAEAKDASAESPYPENAKDRSVEDSYWKLNDLFMDRRTGGRESESLSQDALDMLEGMEHTMSSSSAKHRGLSVEFQDAWQKRAEGIIRKMEAEDATSSSPKQAEGVEKSAPLANEPPIVRAARERQAARLARQSVPSQPEKTSVKSEDLRGEPKVESQTPSTEITIQEGLERRAPGIADTVRRTLQREQEKGQPAFAEDNYIYTRSGKHSVEIENGREALRKMHDTSAEGFQRALERQVGQDGALYGSYNPKAIEFYEGVKAEKAKAQTERDAVRMRTDAEVEALRERQREYDARVDAVKLPTGKRQHLEISTKEGKKVNAPEVSTVYGDWAIRKQQTGYRNQEPYIITHVPSGMSAGTATDMGTAKRIIKSYIESGLDSSSPQFGKDKAAMKTMGDTYRYMTTGGGVEPPSRAAASEPSIVQSAKARKAKRAADKASGIEYRRAGADPYELIDNLTIRGWELYSQKIKPTFEEWAKRLRDEFGPESERHLRTVWRGLNESEPPPSTTAAKREKVTSDRAERDLPPIPKPKRKADEQTLADAKAANDADPTAPIRLTEKALTSKHILSDVETVQLDLRQQHLKNEYARTLKEIAEATDTEVITRKSADADAIEAERQRIEQAWAESGSEKGRSLRAQRLTVDEQFELLPMVGKLTKAKGRKLTTEERAEVETLKNERDTAIKERDAALERARAAELDRHIAKEQRTRRRAQTKETLDAEAVLIKDNIIAELARIRSQSTHASGLAGLDPEGVITKNLLKYAKNRVQAHVGLKAEALIDEVHDLVKDIASKREIAELLAGRMPERKEQSETAKRLADVRKEINSILNAEDIQAGRRTTKQEGPKPHFQRNVRRLKQLQAKEADLAAKVQRPVVDSDFVRPARPTYERTREVLKAEDRVIRLENEWGRRLEKERGGHWARNISGIWKSWLLSSPATQAMNIAGTGTYQGFREAARLPAVIADLAASAVTGRRSIQGPSPSAMLDGVIQAATVGRREAIDTLKHGAPKEISEKHQYHEIDTGVKAIDVVHNAIFRFMSASDRVFYQGAYRRNLIDRATVQAKNEGAKDVKARAKELADSPTKQLDADARHDALVSTFNNSNALSEKIKRARSKVINPRSKLSAKGADRLNAVENLAIDFIMPFDRTPTNVLMRIVEASPAGYLKNAAQLVSAAMRKEMPQEHQRQFAQTFGNATAGSALMGLGWYLADSAKGIITVDDYDVFLNIGGQKINLRTASPAGNILAVGARLRATHENKKSTAGDYAKVLMKEPLNQPLLRSTGMVSEFFRDPARSGEKTAARYASSAIPFSGAVRFTAQMTDREDRRYPKTFGERVKQNVPGLRQSVPVSASPVFRGETKSTEATKELERLNMTVKGVEISPEETLEGYEVRKQRAGAMIVRGVNQLVNSSRYKQLSDEGKKKEIRSIIQNASRNYPPRKTGRQRAVEQ